MHDGHNCHEHPTIINNVEYTVQSRTIALENGEQQPEYRVLLNGQALTDWKSGDIRPYFGISQ